MFTSQHRLNPWVSHAQILGTTISQLLGFFPSERSFPCWSRYGKSSRNKVSSLPRTGGKQRRMRWSGSGQGVQGPGFSSGGAALGKLLTSWSLCFHICRVECYYSILLRLQKRSSATCYSIDELGYPKWNRAVTKEQILSNCTDMRGLKYLETESRVWLRGVGGSKDGVYSDRYRVSGLQEEASMNGWWQWQLNSVKVLHTENRTLTSLCVLSQFRKYKKWRWKVNLQALCLWVLIYYNSSEW